MVQPSSLSNSRMFSSHQNEILYFLAVNFPFPIPQPLATTNLLSLSMDFPILSISYKRNHIIPGLFCLVYFTVLNVFKVHSFYGWYHAIVRINHIFFIHPSVDGHLSCFHLLAIVNIVVMNICVQVFRGGRMFSFLLVCMSRSGMVGSYDNSMFNLLRKC